MYALLLYTYSKILGIFKGLKTSSSLTIITNHFRSILTNEYTKMVRQSCVSRANCTPVYIFNSSRRHCIIFFPVSCKGKKYCTFPTYTSTENLY